MAVLSGMAFFVYFRSMEEASYKEIDLFIREELSQHGEWLVDRFAEALEMNRNIDTGALLDSLDYETGSGPDGSQTLAVSFMTYGRAMEIAGRRRKRKAAWAKKNGDVWGKKNHRGKKVQWYNRNRYAGYGRLIRRLTAGMSDAELQRIRGILQSAKDNFATKS